MRGTLRRTHGGGSVMCDGEPWAATIHPPYHRPGTSKSPSGPEPDWPGRGGPVVPGSAGRAGHFFPSARFRAKNADNIPAN